MGTHPPWAGGAASPQGAVSTCVPPPSSPSWSFPPSALDELPLASCTRESPGCPLASSIWRESDSQANRDQASGESLGSVCPPSRGGSHAFRVGHGWAAPPRRGTQHPSVGFVPRAGRRPVLRGERGRILGP